MNLKRKIIFFILELILGITFGLFCVYTYNTNMTELNDIPLILVFCFTYIFSIAGIAIPGYFYLKLYGNKEMYVPAIFSSTVWTLFAIFLYIILAFFIPFNLTILLSPEGGLIFILIFSVIGFNSFAFNSKQIKMSP